MRDKGVVDKNENVDMEALAHEMVAMAKTLEAITHPLLEMAKVLTDPQVTALVHETQQG